MDRIESDLKGDINAMSYNRKKMTHLHCFEQVLDSKKKMIGILAHV